MSEMSHGRSKALCRYLLACASSDAYIRLGTDGSALAHIHANSHLQQVVNTLYWRRLNLVAAQYGDHSRGLPQCKRCARPRDLYVVERRLLVRGLSVVRIAGGRTARHAQRIRCLSTPMVTTRPTQAKSAQRFRVN